MTPKTLLVAAAALLMQFGAPAAADTYPARPLRFVVPYGPGGATDTYGRVVGEKLAGRLGQPVVMDYKPGAGGTLAAEAVAKAAPDGYTVLVGDVGPNAIAAGLYQKLPYDPERSLAPVSMAVYLPIMLVANNAVPVSNMSELVAYAKAHPRTLSYGSSGNGNIGHLAGALLNTGAGIDLLHVPYRGAPPSITDTIAGQVQVTFLSVISALPHIRAGRLKPIAVTGRSRSPLLPDVATVAESSTLRDYDVVSWGAFFVPAGTPAEVVERLNREIVAVLDMPEVRDRLTQAGFIVQSSTPSQLGAFVRGEVRRWAAVVKATNARPD